MDAWDANSSHSSGIAILPNRPERSAHFPFQLTTFQGVGTTLHSPLYTSMAHSRCSINTCDIELILKEDIILSQMHFTIMAAVIRVKFVI